MKFAYASLILSAIATSAAPAPASNDAASTTLLIMGDWGSASIPQQELAKVMQKVGQETHATVRAEGTWLGWILPRPPSPERGHKQWNPSHTEIFLASSPPFTFKAVVNLGDSMYRIGSEGPVRPDIKDPHLYFYDGVKNTTDHKWELIWSDVYKGRLAEIPWWSVAGNHDWYGNPDAQVEKTGLDGNNWVFGSGRRNKRNNQIVVTA
ncbi:hypothetical protein BDK51DRAFT_31413, partial [Blyttiomyces helicus]